MRQVSDRVKDLRIVAKLPARRLTVKFPGDLDPAKS
jgi:hypothetical protein